MSRKRIYWMSLASLALAGALGGLVLLATRDQEPTYQGKRITQWMEEEANGMMVEDWPWPSSVEVAVWAIGTNGLPWILRELDAHDSWVRRRMMSAGEFFGWRKLEENRAEARHERGLVALGIIGSKALPIVPTLAQRLRRPQSAPLAAAALVDVGRRHTNRDWEQRATGAEKAAVTRLKREVGDAALSALDSSNLTVRLAGAAILSSGTADSDVAIPALIRGSRDVEPRVREQSVRGFHSVTAQTVAVIPVLIEALQDPVVQVRATAASVLGDYGRQAHRAVPYLLTARTDSSALVRAGANRALEQIDPETAAAITNIPDSNARLSRPDVSR